MVRNLEYRAFRADGTIFDMGLSVSLIVDAESRPLGFMGILRDISVGKSRRELIEQLAVEKEMLLGEVHHRIKNHMNTIRSILFLQRTGSSDPAVQEALLAAENRMSIMQSLYQKLYTFEEHDSVHLPSYIGELLSGLRSALSFANQVELRQEIANIEVSAKHSLPVGIVINDLVTNAFKYAFGDSGRGVIAVAVRQEPSGLRIEVCSDGRPMPPDVADGKSFGFGLTLVQGYVDQFEGSLAFGRNGEGMNCVSAFLRLEDTGVAGV